jgi:hypothetical protein
MRKFCGAADSSCEGIVDVRAIVAHTCALIAPFRGLLPCMLPRVTGRRPSIRRDLIEGLGKGLRVIESFDDEHARQTVSEAARRAGITRTAARRHLLSLVHFGYAASDGKLYWLTPRVLRLGHGYLGTARLPRLVQPFIQQHLA